MTRTRTPIVWSPDRAYVTSKFAYGAGYVMLDAAYSMQSFLQPGDVLFWDSPWDGGYRVVVRLLQRQTEREWDVRHLYCGPPGGFDLTAALEGA